MSDIFYCTDFIVGIDLDRILNAMHYSSDLSEKAGTGKDEKEFAGL